MHTQKCFFLLTGKLTLKNLSVLLGEAYAARRCGFPLALKDLGEMTVNSQYVLAPCSANPGMWSIMYGWVGGLMCKPLPQRSLPGSPDRPSCLHFHSPVTLSFNNFFTVSFCTHLISSCTNLERHPDFSLILGSLTAGVCLACRRHSSYLFVGKSMPEFSNGMSLCERIHHWVESSRKHLRSIRPMPRTMLGDTGRGLIRR